MIVTHCPFSLGPIVPERGGSVESGAPTIASGAFQAGSAAVFQGQWWMTYAGAARTDTFLLQATMSSQIVNAKRKR